MVFNSKSWHPDFACTVAVLEASEFLAANGPVRRNGEANQVFLGGNQQGWERPEIGWVKP